MSSEDFDQFLDQIREAHFSEVVLYKAFSGVNNRDVESRQKLLTSISENANIQKVFLIADKETDFHDQFKILIASQSMTLIKISN